MFGLKRPRPAAAADLARLPIAIDLRALSIEEGLRAALSVAVLVVADDLLHAPILLESALGALLTCLCDSGGPIRGRAPVLLSFAAIGSLLIAGFGLARPVGYPLIPLACLGIFGFSFIRIYGPAAQQIGNLLSVVLVLALDHGFHDLRPALSLAAAFGGGSLWALLLTMGIWRLHPNRPTRQAVARVHLALATLCDDVLALLAMTDAADATLWERHARAHRRSVRTLIEQARGVIAERLHAGGTAFDPATRSLLRLESAEQMFRALIALTDLLESGAEPATRHAAARMIERIGRILRVLAPHVVEDTDQRLDEISHAIDGIDADTSDPALRHIADLLTDRLRATLTLTGTIAQDLPAAAQPRLMERLAEPLRANLDWKSAALRHAARAALVAAAGLAITFTWPTSYQHWLTITLVLTLQPYYALTLQRALERIGGTVLGGLVAAVLSLICRTPLAMAAALFPLSMLALSLRAVNFGLYVTALTPLIVLLVELGHAGHGHFTVAIMRALYTLIGGALAVLGCIFLWPSWEPDRLDRELREAVRRHGSFAELELGVLQGEVRPEAVVVAARAAGMASNNLEASLSRALVEPGGRRDRLAAATMVDASLRRLAGRLSAMQIDPTLDSSTAPTADAMRQWRGWIVAAITLMDQVIPPALPDRPTALPPDRRLGDSLSRIARQLELSASALRTYGAG